MPHLIVNKSKRTVIIKESAEGAEIKKYSNASLSAIDKTQYGLYSNDRLMATFPQDKNETTIADEEEVKP